MPLRIDYSGSRQPFLLANTVDKVWTVKIGLVDKDLVLMTAVRPVRSC